MPTFLEQWPVTLVTEGRSWKALAVHFQHSKRLHLRDLFANDPRRGERLTAEAVGIHLDCSKTRITDETLKILVQPAEESGVRTQIDAMFQGEKLNTTEDRAALHVLREPHPSSCAKVAAAARRGGRTRVGCIILRRGEEDSLVRGWLVTAAKVPGFIGFAVGRTVFWEPLIEFQKKTITREEAVAKIAERYRSFAEIFDGRAYAAA
jgi:glucose-6-phosphate isomerase